MYGQPQSGFVQGYQPQEQLQQENQPVQFMPQQKQQLQKQQPQIQEVSYKNNARTEQIRNEFAQIDKDGNSQVTFQEMCDFLDKKGQQDFDKDMATQIFQKLDQNRNGFITVDEFAQGYSRTEQELQQRYMMLQEKIDQDNLKKAESEQRLLESRSKEETNQYNIMKGSKLTVRVKAARSLIPMGMGGKSNPYCILQCEKQRCETRSIPNNLNPEWEESFSFEISHGTENLKVIVMDKQNFGKDDFEGQIEIPLSALKDQMKHEQWFQLQGNREIGQNGEIQLVLQ